MFREHGLSLVRLAVLLTGDRATAEDVVQDAFLGFQRALPRLRETVEHDLRSSPQLTRERVLACAVRLLDRGFFRIGTEEYTVTNESYGLATMRKEHVTVEPDGTMVFDYPAKSGKRRIQAVVDPLATEIVGQLIDIAEGFEWIGHRVQRNK